MISKLVAVKCPPSPYRKPPVPAPNGSMHTPDAHVSLKSAVLKLFRLTDHFVNFVSVRGPPRPWRAKAGPREKKFKFTPKIYKKSIYPPNFRITFFSQLHKLKWEKLLEKCLKFFLLLIFFFKIEHMLGLAHGPPGTWRSADHRLRTAALSWNFTSSSHGCPLQCTLRGFWRWRYSIKGGDFVLE